LQVASRITIHPLSNAKAAPAGVGVDQALIQRLQESFRSSAEHGTELADLFFARLFSEHPELRTMFPADMTAQKKKLVDTLSMVIEHLQRPQVVRARIEHLGMAHRNYGAKPEHYPYVAQALIGAMAETAGSHWTGDLQGDWTVAIRLIALAMIDASNRVG
jgi:hemoglobin-like flavoprotein